VVSGKLKFTMIMPECKKTSREWCRELRIAQRDILDPDGWDRTNFDYSFRAEKVSLEEFGDRLGCSTVRFSAAINRFFRKRDKKFARV